MGLALFWPFRMSLGKAKSLLPLWWVEVSHQGSKHVTSGGAKTLEEKGGRVRGTGKGRGRMGCGVHFNRVVRESLSEEMVFEQKPEEVRS